MDDPRLLPAKIEMKLVDDLLEGRLTPQAVTHKRNRLLAGMYGPAQTTKKRAAPKKRIECPYCDRGLINGRTEGCGNCHGNGWVLA